MKCSLRCGDYYTCDLQGERISWLSGNPCIGLTAGWLWELIAWLYGQDHSSNHWWLITRNKIGLLLKRLTVCQMLPMYVETQMFIAVFTRARHRTLEPLVSIISQQHHNVCKISFSMILPSSPRSYKWFFSLSFIYWPLLGVLSSPSHVFCSPPVSAAVTSSP